MPQRTRVQSSLAAPLRVALASLVLATLAAGCSKKGADDSAAGSADEGSSTVNAGDMAAALSKDVKGKVHLEVTGGKHAGTYDAQMKDGGCSYGLAGDGSWGNQFSIDTKDANQFSSLQLVVPKSKSAAGGTSNFQLTAGFGPIFGDGATSYDVNPSNGKGSGKVTVDDKGSTGTVSFDAKTADGVGLKGTIECDVVLRAG